MSKQFLVVAYDISNDRRRTKMHDMLLQYGNAVQYSVFECLLDEKGLARMKRAINKIIRPKADHVRYYYLCQACVQKIEVTSGPEALGEVTAIVV